MIPNPNELLGRIIGKSPIRSQREACTVAARRSIAAFGPYKSDSDIRNVCTGLASGLFGEAFASGSPAERTRMITLVEAEYRKCVSR